MLPKINGKDLLDCTEDDFCEIIDNLDYRENEYLDYKEMVHVLAIRRENKNAVANAKAEFRSDVCSFANANGGYIIYGIEEDSKSVPKEIKGIEIKNDDTDKFELDIKNWLQTIRPRIPNYKISFLKLKNGKYIVVLYIYHDFFAPYIHLEDNKNYRIYKRVGNSKVVVGYSELKNMFTTSLSLEKEVERFRRERIDNYKAQADYDNQQYSQFLMLHIIPDTFLDSNYNSPVYVLYRSEKLGSGLFSEFGCNDQFFPTIEGMRFTSYSRNDVSLLYNNGIAECFYSISDDIYLSHNYPKGFFRKDEYWGKIEKTILKYCESFNTTLLAKRLFICISIIGCKDVVTEDKAASSMKSVIDRDYLICVPNVITDFHSVESLNDDLKTAKLEYLLSLGIKHADEVKSAIDSSKKSEE